MTDNHYDHIFFFADSLRALSMLVLTFFAACSPEREAKDWVEQIDPPLIQVQMLSGVWSVLPETLEIEGGEVPIDSSWFVVNDEAIISVGSDDVSLGEIETRLGAVLVDYINQSTERGMQLRYSYEADEGSIIEVSLIGESRIDEPQRMNVVASSVSRAGSDYQVSNWSAVFERE